VTVLDVDEWEGCLFIAMELLSGESLEAKLDREGRLSPELTLEILDQVARGLLKAHAARLVHRDLKPENIFLVAEQPLLVKILDFGVAKHLDAITGAQTATGALVGTPWYMSPEQALGDRSVDFRSDLWSLGVVAFRCLTGTLPFDGDGLGRVLLEIMHGTIPSPRTFNSGLPQSVDDWWFRTMQRDPASRPPSVTALVNELREALAPSSEWPDSAPEPPHEPPETLPPVAASRRGPAPALVWYSVASVPALVVSGWLVGSWLWPAPRAESWRTDHLEPGEPLGDSVPDEPRPASPPLDPPAPPAAPAPAAVPLEPAPSATAPVAKDAPERKPPAAATRARPKPTPPRERTRPGDSRRGRAP
jgi:serine/threonine-protein kinase